MNGSDFDGRRQDILAAAHRDIMIRSMRKRLVNRDFTILSNSCVGGLIYKDLGLPFLTPTVNLSIKRSDFIRMCLDLRVWMERDLAEEETDDPYPVGRIGDIRIDFIHYSSFSEARDDWERRKARIRYDNIYVVMKAGGRLSPQDAEAFRRIPYPKVVLVPWEAAEPWEFQITGVYEERRAGKHIAVPKTGISVF